MKRHGHFRRTNERRGVVLPLVAVSMVTLMAFAVLAIDAGYLFVVKSELQRSADNGALGGAIRYADVYTTYGNTTVSAQLAEVTSGAQSYVAGNVAGGGPIALETSMITRGYLSDPYDPTEVIDTSVDPSTFNVVEVTTRRTANSVNGAVGLFFAPVLGKFTADVTAKATAVLDDRFAGIEVPLGMNGPLIPFVLKASDWDDQIVNGNGLDEWSVDNAGNVTYFSDGVPEIQLFVQELGPSNNGGGGENAKAGGNGGENGNGENAGAGNFGILNIGVPSNSEMLVEAQINNGITGDELYDEFGTTELMVYDPGGSPLNYSVTGNPGIKAGMKDDLEARIGETVGFFVYDTLVSGTGNNATFNIVGIQFGKVMQVQLTGSDKKVVIQPAEYVSSYVITADTAPTTDGMIANLTLIR